MNSNPLAEELEPVRALSRHYTQGALVSASQHAPVSSGECVPLSTGKHALMNEPGLGHTICSGHFCVGIHRSCSANFKNGLDGLWAEWLGFFLQLRINVTGLPWDRRRILGDQRWHRKTFVLCSNWDFYIPVAGLGWGGVDCSPEWVVSWGQGWALRWLAAGTTGSLSHEHLSPCLLSTEKWSSNMNSITNYLCLGLLNFFMHKTQLPTDFCYVKSLDNHSSVFPIVKYFFFSSYLYTQ